MDAAHVRMLFDYTAWANARVLDAAAALTGEQFGRDLGSSFPSVRDTLGHIAAADWIWMERWQGRSPSAPPAWHPVATLGNLHERWGEVLGAREAFLADQTDETLAQPLEYASMRGASSAQPLWQQLQHVVNHATYHRGQVTTMIRQLGGSMVSTDLVTYLRECPYDAAAQPVARGQSVSLLITRRQQEALRDLGIGGGDLRHEAGGGPPAAAGARVLNDRVSRR